MADVYIFSSGSQFGDWTASNCERCTKGAEEGQWPTCEIEAALTTALWEGTVSVEMAQRAGKPAEPEYVWPCGEVEWTEEWKAEFRRRQAEQF